MNFTPGDYVVVRGQLAIVVEERTVADQEFVGVTPIQAVQWVPAAMVNTTDQGAGGPARPQAQPQAQPQPRPQPPAKH